MTTWTPDELDRIGDAEEIEIASQRPDGSLAPYVIIWVVRSGEDLYVRSAHGRGLHVVPRGRATADPRSEPRL